MLYKGINYYIIIIIFFHITLQKKWDSTVTILIEARGLEGPYWLECTMTVYIKIERSFTVAMTKIRIFMYWNWLLGYYVQYQATNFNKLASKPGHFKMCRLAYLCQVISLCQQNCNDETSGTQVGTGEHISSPDHNMKGLVLWKFTIS